MTTSSHISRLPCLVLLGLFLLLGIPATPSQPSISPPPGRVEPGASATFSCTSAGFSPPAITVTWLKDGRGLSARQPIVQPPGDSTSYEVTSTVDVQLTKMDVKSQLTCQIQHSTLKAPLQQTIRLGSVLRVPPTVQVETTSPPPPIQLNALVMITCKAERFYPSDATLVWLENGKETGQGKTDPVTQDSNGLFSLKSSLEVNATEEKNMTEFTCRVKHDSQPPVNGSLELKIGVQPPKDGDPFVPGQWLLSNPGLWIGLFLSKCVGFLLLVYLFLRKEHGKITLQHMIKSAQGTGMAAESPT
ncbi:signal-regulatory protein beta-1-like isoform X2 [Hemicordylus capensis]|uniref:signal-regulatory protein beta-1-like isoform X2 n=1 Tax=Hemicordylus capensis TaxID=884348 RepID=UPI002302452B|nr:signal-regulatory protein beta-1-like isoform X2 [Hemicordylus capensis]